MAERLVNLKQLKVRDCKAMKGIVKGRKTGEDTPFPQNTILFPKLVTLALDNLSALNTLVSIGDDEGKTIPIPKYTFNGMVSHLYFLLSFLFNIFLSIQIFLTFL